MEFVQISVKVTGNNSHERLVLDRVMKKQEGWCSFHGESGIGTLSKHAMIGKHLPQK